MEVGGITAIGNLREMNSPVKAKGAIKTLVVASAFLASALAAQAQPFATGIGSTSAWPFTLAVSDAATTAFMLGGVVAILVGIRGKKAGSKAVDVDKKA
jgi:hypothetical protein